MRNLSFTEHCILAFLVRILLIVYASFHDAFFTPSYTDIDYKVFTDAARHIVNGNSPFERHTYRYTPLLAWLLTPNILLHTDFGKILFSLVDILVAVLIRKILIQQNSTKKPNVDVCTFLWLYNPLTIVISTRGNADSIAVLLVVSTLHFLQNDKFILAGILHGLSVHFRLYPVAFSMVMFLSLRKNNNIIPNVSQLQLVCSCILSILFLTFVNYCFYGYEFLYESVLYHLIRKDTRHNFSVYFYMLYLSANHPPALIQKIFTFLPQLILLILLSFRYSRKSELPFSMFVQAMVMVTYNPVLTSQYFFWFLSLLPLCIQRIKMSIYKSLSLIFVWMSSQGIWLLFAYCLEFQGYNSFVYIWLSSLLFFAVNVNTLRGIVTHYE